MNNLIENEELIDELANQLNDTEEANHKAFVAIEREEPWLAYIGTQSVFLEKWGKYFKLHLKSESTGLLQLMDKENGSVAPVAMVQILLPGSPS